MRVTNENIGKRIETVITGLGMSRKKLGEILGVGEGAVGRYIRGEADPGSVAVARIATLGKVSTDWLITGHDPPKEKSELTTEEIFAQAANRPELMARLKAHARHQVQEEMTEYRQVQDPGEVELLRHWRSADTKSRKIAMLALSDDMQELEGTLNNGTVGSF